MPHPTSRGVLTDHLHPASPVVNGVRDLVVGITASAEFRQGVAGFDARLDH